MSDCLEEITIKLLVVAHCRPPTCRYQLKCDLLHFVRHYKFELNVDSDCHVSNVQLTYNDKIFR